MPATHVNCVCELALPFPHWGICAPLAWRYDRSKCQATLSDMSFPPVVNPLLTSPVCTDHSPPRNFPQSAKRPPRPSWESGTAHANMPVPLSARQSVNYCGLLSVSAGVTCSTRLPITKAET